MDLNQKIQELETLVKKQGADIQELQASFKKLQLRAMMPPTPLDTGEEFEVLKALLETAAWPPAVEPYLICNTTSDQDKKDRAEGILDIIIDVHLEKLKFLDFGCGEGHVVHQSIVQNPALAVGYDLVASEQWKEFGQKPQTLFTNSWEEVAKNGPYNVVILYDVIDHMVTDEPVENLKKIRSVLAPNAKIFVRCHPWCSRHATHLYHKINKAFIHLVFSKDELKSLGYEGQPTREVIHPLSHYNEWFKLSGFHLLKKERTTNSAVESFFTTTPLVASRIKRNWRKSNDPELRDGKKFPWHLELQFVDYILGIK